MEWKEKGVGWNDSEIHNEDDKEQNRQYGITFLEDTVATCVNILK